MPHSDRRPTVLVVDHDVWERTFTTNTLTSHGYAVFGASNGATGLRLAQQHPCDAVLLNLALPEVPGLEVIQRLKAMDQTRAIPVIGLGASTTDQRVKSEGCIPMPLEQRQIISELGRCLHTADSQRAV